MLADDVIELVAKYAGRPTERVTLTARLREDLGIDGADALELLEEFAKGFGVDMAGYTHSQYFGPEAVFKLVRPPCSITVASLWAIAIRRKW